MMKPCFAAAMLCVLLTAPGCDRSPSTTPAASLTQDELKPVGTTGTALTPPPAGFDLVNLRNGPGFVNCGADRRPVIRQVQVNGNIVDHVECVNVAGTAYTPVATRTVTEQRVVRSEPRRSNRSLKKSALVIGGSSAAGAGIGALIGGKKGALIGAATGGGAGTVYEVRKRKKK